jgi:cytidylate kinase
MAYIVAIDGPAGAGKSTIAKMTAERLGLTRVDTGAIYRVVALVAEEGSLADEETIASVCPELPLRFEGARVMLAGRDVSTAIRTEKISQRASQVSALPRVRAGLLELQRRLGREHPIGAVLEGRDIGTVVFPDAEVKIFLTASPEERARRRVRELGASAVYEEILASIRERDERDSNRPIAPLKPAPDAVLVDSTSKTLEEVLAEIEAIVRRTAFARRA